MNKQEFKTKFEKIPIKEYPNQVPSNVKVTVCVQTYQHAPFIKQCLDSILSQKTDFDYEILLGEDSSTDGTREICIEYAEKYPSKIRLFLHHRENNIHVNGKPTGRFNWINNLFEARGKYIAFCEGDDYWTVDHKLQKQVKFLDENKNYNLVSHRIQALNENNVLKTKKYVCFRDGRYYLFRNFTYTLSVMFRNNDKLIDLPDYFLRTKMADFPTNYLVSNSKRVKKFREVMGVRRIHEGGVWSQLQNGELLQAGIEAREEMKPYIDKDDVPYLNAGFNRYRTKKYISSKRDIDIPVLIDDAIYINRFKLILAIAKRTNSKLVLRILDIMCNF